MTLEPRDRQDLSAARVAPKEQRRKTRPYWTPTLPEALVGGGLAGVWILATVVAIRHEDVGVLLTIVYVAMALVGAIVTWLIVWPLMRMLM